MAAFIGGMTSAGDFAANSGAGSEQIPPAALKELNALNPDIRFGVIIVIVIVCIVLGLQVIIQSSSDVLEQAETSQALVRMGAPRRFLSVSAWLENLLPVVVALATAPIGWLLAQPQAAALERFTGREVSATPAPLITVIVLGIGLTVCALIVVGPLRRQVSTRYQRGND
ncbi:FtsX-like permease family protein [Nanchangia anserum]|nr:FtsX-like permease family protein [Nanchangia anserum]QOX81191.1 FtsX-like permease family protein [Nanchangia anserum]